MVTRRGRGRSLDQEEEDTGEEYQPRPLLRMCWCDAVSKWAPDIARYPDEDLSETLGLYTLPLRRADLPSAKA